MGTNVNEEPKKMLRPTRLIKWGKRASIKQVPSVWGDKGDVVRGYKWVSYEMPNSRSLDRSREPNMKRTGSNSNRRKVFA